MRVTFTLLLFLFSFTVSAQTIQGYVSDEKTKEPLIGASVEIKKAKKGVVTDLSGKFSIQGNVGDVLNIHYTGFESINITVTDSKEIKVSLKSVAEQLKEAVVVGYGTKTRKDITGSISSVSTKEMDKRPLPRLENMLQGQAAGVQVTQFSGKPGNALSIRVRGATSISAGSEPLYVLDGIPLLDAEGINAADIASIEVLKDASASAIYGARAANGVVLITTKLGAAGSSQAAASLSSRTVRAAHAARQTTPTSE